MGKKVTALSRPTLVGRFIGWCEWAGGKHFGPLLAFLAFLTLLGGLLALYHPVRWGAGRDVGRELDDV